MPWLLLLNLKMYFMLCACCVGLMFVCHGSHFRFYHDKDILGSQWISLLDCFQLHMYDHIHFLLWVSIKTRILCSQWVSLHLLALLTNPFFDSFQLHMYDDHIHMEV